LDEIAKGNLDDQTGCFFSIRFLNVRTKKGAVAKRSARQMLDESLAFGVQINVG
jgi:hypothetical protein